MKINELEVIKYLINEIEEERALFVEYEKAKKEAKAKVKIDSYFETYYCNLHAIWGDKREPKKGRIKQNCIKIRQLLLKVAEEADGY